MKKHVNVYLIFGVITSLIGTALGASVASSNPYAGFPWLLATLLAFVTSLVGTFRLRSVNEPYKFGVIAIQHIWWTTSIGFAGVLFFPADYFMKAGGTGSIAMAVISAIWLIWGLYLIFAVNRETKAPVAP